MWKSRSKAVISLLYHPEMCVKHIKGLVVEAWWDKPDTAWH